MIQPEELKTLPVGTEFLMHSNMTDKDFWCKLDVHKGERIYRLLVNGGYFSEYIILERYNTPYGFYVICKD